MFFVQLRRYLNPRCPFGMRFFELTLLNQERDDRKADFNADFSQLQEILRHSLHVGEAISVTVGTTKDMRKCRRKILHRNSGNSGDDTLLQDKTHYHMAFQTQLIQNFSLRQQSNQNRLQTEITLVCSRG